VEISFIQCQIVCNGFDGKIFLLTQKDYGVRNRTC